MRKTLLAMVGLVCVTGFANALDPLPGNSSVEPCDSFGAPPGSGPGMIIYPNPLPGGAAEFTCTIRNDNNIPIPNAFVEIVFMVYTNHEFCPEAVLWGITDSSGDVTFNISAGGCTTGQDAVEIIANGMVIRTYQNLKSPDFDGTANGAVDLGDYITFGSDFSAGSPGCHDYFNDGSCELGDFIVFGEAWGRVCAP